MITFAGKIFTPCTCTLSILPSRLASSRLAPASLLRFPQSNGLGPWRDANWAPVGALARPLERARKTVSICRSRYRSKLETCGVSVSVSVSS